MGFPDVHHTAAVCQCAEHKTWGLFFILFCFGVLFSAMFQMLTWSNSKPELDHVSMYFHLFEFMLCDWIGVRSN